jgi:hypothetical protein
MRQITNDWKPALFVLGLAACAATSGGGRAAAPRIDAIRPDSGPAGAAYPIEATLTGSGFDSTGNTVRFGSIVVPGQLSSRGGTVLTFPVPKEMASRGEVPPMVLEPGRYEVTVTTRAGMSNKVTFTLTPGS